MHFFLFSLCSTNAVIFPLLTLLLSVDNGRSSCSTQELRNQLGPYLKRYLHVHHYLLSPLSFVGFSFLLFSCYGFIFSSSDTQNHWFQFFLLFFSLPKGHEHNRKELFVQARAEACKNHRGQDEQMPGRCDTGARIFCIIQLASKSPKP